MISVLGKLALPDLRTIELRPPLDEYVEIRREHGQVLNLLAVIEGLKPCLDDWIPVRAMERYQGLCGRLGLTVRAAVQFDVMTHDDAERAIGSGTLTTTRARARELGDPRGSVHVFVGRDPAVVEATLQAGWYPLVVGERATSKPWIDHIWFGEGLGYPRCCLEAFARHNNWAVNNMPYQAFRSTSRPLALCNSIMRFTGLTWAPHLPCSYDCAATAAQSGALRDLTFREAPALVPIVDSLCAGTFLLLSEWEAFVLHDADHHDADHLDADHHDALRGDHKLRYRGSSLVPSNRPNLRLFEALEQGDRIEIRDDLVVVFDGGDLRWIEECRTDGFAPRIPMLLTFAARDDHR